MHTFTRIVLDPRWLAGSGALPSDYADDDDYMDPGPPDPHNDADFGHGCSAPGSSRAHRVRLGH